MVTIDLNCDMGESFGVYSLGSDEAILDYVSSCNIACGFHAGDPSVMRRTVRMALEKGVAIGAHPGFPDLSGFGRRTLSVTPQEAYDMTLYQIGALNGFISAEGGRMNHVKPHGAFYNMAAKDGSLAEAIAKAVHDFDASLVLYGLANSELTAAGERAGLKIAAEAFCDRAYQEDGSLMPRGAAGALITDPQQAIAQVLSITKEHKAMTLQQQEVPLQADTICLHGDGANALTFARDLTHALEQAGIRISAVS